MGSTGQVSQVALAICQLDVETEPQQIQLSGLDDVARRFEMTLRQIRILGRAGQDETGAGDDGQVGIVHRPLQQCLGDSGGLGGVSPGQLEPRQGQSHQGLALDPVVEVGVEAFGHDQLAVCGREVIEHERRGTRDVKATRQL